MTKPLHFWALPIAAAICTMGGILFSAGASAQTGTPPKPIPTPPIPAPAQLGPAPRIRFGLSSAPRPPVISIPDPVSLAPVVMPPPAQVTAADPKDATRPPASGTLTGPTAMVSPGANPGAIEEVTFMVDPENAQIPAAAGAKLREAATSLKQNPAARIEVRIFTPSKQNGSQSSARRLSLARYLEIRDFLVHAGVAETRIDGRPLLAEANALNQDRVELYIEH